MADFRFVHAADLHLDSPFKGLALGSAAERMRPLFEQATFRALGRIVDLCLREKAAFLVLAGDLFDAKDRSVRARLALCRELERLDRAGIRTFVVHGNHDPLGTLRPGAGLPPSVKVFGPEWEEVELKRGRATLCRIQGVSYASEIVREDLSAQFARQGPEFTVGVLHANVGGDRAHANYAPCTTADLSERALDYWALGHVHTRSVMRLEGGALAVYPGNPQGRHVNEAGARGCALVEVREGRAEARFVDLDVIRWHAVNVEVDGVASLEELGERVEEQLRELSGVEGVEGHAARITLCGRGAVHAELARPEALEQLEEAWRERLAALQPPWALEAVREATAAELDLLALREGGGLLGEILEAAEDPAVPKELWAEEELAKLARALERFKVPMPKEEAPALLRAAAAAVVERLMEEPA
jgi:DNA repair exonuclease SbcCD nuclease subunit